MDSMRKIIHVDMDAFFASVEQRDNPALAGKPVAVGGSSERGVVAAASYEARKYGVHSAMPSVIAFRKCPDIIFVPPDFEKYKAVSRQIRAIFYEYTDLVEPLSLDEAYLDVTRNKKQMPSATIIAKEIKQRIRSATQLTASAGISINKFLAKVASDLEKPDGLTLIPPAKAEKFVEQLNIEKFHGIGKVTAKKMHALGIRTGLDLKQWSEASLVRHFGKAGRYYYTISRAIDHREVEPNRIRKSIGAENTFESDLIDKEAILSAFESIAQTVIARLDKSEVYGKTLTIKLKFNNFVQVTRSKTVPYLINSTTTIMRITEELCETVNFDRGVRLLGITATNLLYDNKTALPLTPGMQLTMEF